MEIKQSDPNISVWYSSFLLHIVSDYHFRWGLNLPSSFWDVCLWGVGEPIVSRHPRRWKILQWEHETANLNNHTKNKCAAASLHVISKQTEKGCQQFSVQLLLSRWQKPCRLLHLHIKRRAFPRIIKRTKNFNCRKLSNKSFCWGVVCLLRKDVISTHLQLFSQRRAAEQTISLKVTPASCAAQAVRDFSRNKRVNLIFG